jgi:LysR family nitrogen assimilation transcriptional regulator
MNFRQIHAFVAVATDASFSRAAIRLGMNQPGLSRVIRELEDDLGIKLFYRDGRGVQLTEPGRRFLENAKSILRAVEDARADVLSADKTTRCVVALAPTIARYMSSAIVQSVAVSVPSLEIRIVEAFSGHILEWLSTNRIDIAIVYSNHAPANFPSESITTERLHLIGPAGMAQAGGKVRFDQLGDFPLVMPGVPHGARKIIDDIARERGVVLKYRIEVDGLGAIIDLVRHHVGFGLLPLAPLEAELRAGQIASAEVIEPELHREIVAVTARNKPVTGYETYVIKAVRALFAETSNRNQL